MLTFLVNLLILVVIAIVVFYVAKWLMGEAEIDPPLRKIALLILFIVFLIALINLISGHALWGPMIVIPAA